MKALSRQKVQEVVTNPYSELRIPSGTSPDRIASVYRNLCLNELVQLHQSENEKDPDVFQRQTIAYRFLTSLPLIEKECYRPQYILHNLRPVEAKVGDEKNERACAMLDIAIETMEQAQRPWEFPYTNYVITVHYCMRKHLVRRRYQEFEVLHQILEKKIPVIPKLPEKKWFYKFTMPNERARALSLYLTRIIRILSLRGLFSMDIMTFLEIDYSRIKAEEETIAIEFLSKSQVNTNFYLIHAGWLHQWRRFIIRGFLPPGPITNTHLFDFSSNTGTTKVLKEHLVIVKHYRCLSFQVWSYFQQVYGGGPCILRETKNIYTKKIYDMTLLAIFLQKIVRGFLARQKAKKTQRLKQLQNPHMEVLNITKSKHFHLEERMKMIRQYVCIKEYQTQQIAAIKIQKKFRRFLAKLEHQLLMNESAVPEVVHNFQQIEEYLSLEEIGLMQDASKRLAHFLVTMNKGVPIQKIPKSKGKTHPKWCIFKINQIGSHLEWNSHKKKLQSHTISFVDCTNIKKESPLVLKNVFRQTKKTFDHAILVQYNTMNGNGRKENSQQGKLILICESVCDQDALYQGLYALIQEARARIENGASYVDGYGVIRKKVPHAKRLIREALRVLEEEQQKRHASPIAFSKSNPIDENNNNNSMAPCP